MRGVIASPVALRGPQTAPHAFGRPILLLLGIYQELSSTARSPKRNRSTRLAAFCVLGTGGLMIRSYTGIAARTATNVDEPHVARA